MDKFEDIANKLNEMLGLVEPDNAEYGRFERMNTFVICSRLTGVHVLNNTCGWEPLYNCPKEIREDLHHVDMHKMCDQDSQRLFQIEYEDDGITVLELPGMLLTSKLPEFGGLKPPMEEIHPGSRGGAPGNFDDPEMFTDDSVGTN